jgi:N-acetylated-alpha-linked acidic dipeptidase
MRPIVPLLVLCSFALACLAPAVDAAAAAPLVGFTAASSITERAREAAFDATLDAASQSAWMKRLAAVPHNVGTAADHANADFIASLYRSWGFDTHIERFSLLYPIPKRRVLQLVAPTRYTAPLFEPPVPGDPTTAQAGRLPSYNIYSVDGDVTAPLVYVNYGIPADYLMLARHGIDVRGKIVIARYGGAWRGVKPMVAAQHGAVGCIIYSDPADDGYNVGLPYPYGSARNANAVQRGSVLDTSTKPGDPGNDRSLLASIPVLPISANDARPLLAALGGAVVPAAWRGAYPFTYRFGSGRALVHLAVAFDWTHQPLEDVIATMRGSDLPDEWVIRGNHDDAWVNGAQDPLSGQVAMLEEARGIGALARRGMRPRRTVIFCSWDGEEAGLAGSTAWTTAHEADLRTHADIYINTDTNARGTIEGDGEPVLGPLFNGVARDVTDPERNVSAYERKRDRQLVDGTVKPADAGADIVIPPLGSGTDFDSFSQHVGIQSLDLSYGDEIPWGSYHSDYDTFAAFTRFEDPGFRYGILLAQTGGRMILRTANADLLPYRFTPLATALASYVADLDNEIATMRADSAKHALLEHLNAYQIASNPDQPEQSFGDDGVVPPVDLTPLTDAVARLARSAAACDALLDAASPAQFARAARLDMLVRSTERALLDPNGLPHRPWRRNEITAPGRYTGYAPKTLPYAREAVEARDWDAAHAGVLTIAAAIDRYTAAVDGVAAALAPATPQPALVKTAASPPPDGVR